MDKHLTKKDEATEVKTENEEVKTENEEVKTDEVKKESVKENEKGSKETKKYVDKDTFDKLASELSEYKKMVKAKATDEELEMMAKQEKEKEMETLRKELKRANLTTSLAEIGLAKEEMPTIIESILSGDELSIIDSIKTVINSKTTVLSQELESLKLNNMHRPTGSKIDNKRDFKSMTIDEKTKLKKDNPVLYEQLKNK